MLMLTMLAFSLESKVLLTFVNLKKSIYFVGHSESILCFLLFFYNLIALVVDIPWSDIQAVYLNILSILL